MAPPTLNGEWRGHFALWTMQRMNRDPFLVFAGVCAVLLLVVLTALRF